MFKMIFRAAYVLLGVIIFGFLGGGITCTIISLQPGTNSSIDTAFQCSAWCPQKSNSLVRCTSTELDYLDSGCNTPCVRYSYISSSSSSSSNPECLELPKLKYDPLLIVGIVLLVFSLLIICCVGCFAFQSSRIKKMFDIKLDTSTTVSVDDFVVNIN